MLLRARDAAHQHGEAAGGASAQLASRPAEMPRPRTQHVQQLEPSIRKLKRAKMLNERQ
jgi:hypothetical protein